MSVIASSEGSLYELMCRGKKDTYFYEDTRNSVLPFDTSYAEEEQIIREIRRIPPTTGMDFGKMIEFPIDIVGDVLESITLLINLPTWIPPLLARTFQSIQVTDLSGTTYGYVNGIAYFLFEKIQLYQDTTVIQEFSGDYLWAASQTEGTYAQSFVDMDETGMHDGSTISIGGNAAPHSLRLKLPSIGCAAQDRGFPLIATTAHTYRLKCKLRKLEDLVESSDAQPKPTPWGKQLQALSITGTSPFQALDRSQMAPLRVDLETCHIFLTNVSKDELKKKPQEVPFKKVFENISIQTEKEASSVAVNRRIDGCHPSPRVLWFFRTLADIQANRLWNVVPSYSTIGLTIAGKARETNWSSSIWRDVNNFAKEEIDTGTEISTMNWGLGVVAPQKYPFRQADGTLNFTTADRPTFYIALTPSGPTELRVFVEGWASFLTDGNRAEVLSYN